MAASSVQADEGEDRDRGLTGRDRHVPQRRCVATRAVLPVDRLLRFVIGPDGTLVCDLRRRLPGRGVWVTATRACLAEAIRRKAFSRAFKAPVRVEGDQGAVVDVLMERAALDALSLANKAGDVVAGYTRVEAAIAEGRVGLLLHASDGAQDGIDKLERRAAGRCGPQIAASVRLFSGEQLALALGRTHVVHVAVNAGGACRALTSHCLALDRFRGGPAGRAPDPATDGEPAGAGAADTHFSTPSRRFAGSEPVATDRTGEIGDRAFGPAERHAGTEPTGSEAE